MKFRNTNYFIFFILILILASNAYALGVSPARATADFVPNAEFDVQLCFQPNEIKTLKISKDGPLADRITLKRVGEDGIIDAEITPCITYTVHLPEKIETPGIQQNTVSATEIRQDATGMLSVLVKIIHQLWIQVPYPGQYLEYQFTAENVKAGEEVQIRVNYVSRGDQKLDSIHGKITIYDINNKTLGNVETDRAYNILPGQSGELKAKWNSSPNREGRYRAELKLIYAGMQYNATSNFKLGALDVYLINNTDEVVIGGIKPFGIIVESIWSEPIKNVHAKVSLFNYTRYPEALTSFETITRTLDPWQTAYLEGFVDTDKLGVGEYDMKMYLTFEDKERLYEKKLKVVPVPPPPSEKKEFSWSGIFSITNILIVLGMLLIIVLIILVYILLPKKEKKNEEKTEPKKQ
jgi:hypothetical protein